MAVTLTITEYDSIDATITELDNITLNIVENLTVQGAALNGSGSPQGVTTPAYRGQTYTDTDTDQVYYAVGLTNTSWKEIILNDA
jgi:hypothetical protein